MEQYYLLRIDGDASHIIAYIEKEGAVVQQLEATNIARQLARDAMLANVKGAHSYFAYITLHFRPEWGSLTNEIYPETAKAFGAKPSAVEKALRMALHGAWPNMPEKYKRRFRDRNSPPKLLEFLAVMRDIVEEELVRDFEIQKAE